MKHKSILIIVALLLSFSVRTAATGENGRNSYPEGKFVDRFSSSSLREDGGVGDTGGESDGLDLDEPNSKYRLNPIGDALPLLFVFGVAYGFYVFAGKRKTAEIK
jgi:hypothetical protein